MNEAEIITIAGEELYRCRNCDKLFSLKPAHYTPIYGISAYYCSYGCSKEYNKCHRCGNNRHFECTCNEEDYYG
jgi:hypothetical protein